MRALGDLRREIDRLRAKARTEGLERDEQLRLGSIAHELLAAVERR